MHICGGGTRGASGATSSGVDRGCPTVVVCPAVLAALLGGAAINRGALIDAEQEIGAVWLRIAQCRAFYQRLVGVVIIMILDVAVVLTVSILVHQLGTGRARVSGMRRLIPTILQDQHLAVDIHLERCVHSTGVRAIPRIAK